MAFLAASPFGELARGRHLDYDGARNASGSQGHGALPSCRSWYYHELESPICMACIGCLSVEVTWDLPLTTRLEHGSFSQCWQLKWNGRRRAQCGNDYESPTLNRGASTVFVEEVQEHKEAEMRQRKEEGKDLPEEGAAVKLPAEVREPGLQSMEQYQQYT
mmetsp:Transcript_68896/g.201732  ORF Transcript_68896/g.201732 Transcript_68896/m.201732 type:complete len:161 (+) Transcript_68896:172-654(+)